MSTPNGRIMRVGASTITAYLLLTDALGQTVAITGTPSWSSSDAGVASVTGSATGTSATILAVAAGTCRITVSSNAGAYVGIQDITVVAPDNQIITIKLSGSGEETVTSQKG